MSPFTQIQFAQFRVFLACFLRQSKLLDKFTILISVHTASPLLGLQSTKPFASTLYFTETKDQFATGNSAIKLFAP